MKTTLSQYCINVSDMERAVAFYEGAIGLSVTHRVQEDGFREVILGTDGGARVQLAQYDDHTGHRAFKGILEALCLHRRLPGPV